MASLRDVLPLAIAVLAAGLAVLLQRALGPRAHVQWRLRRARARLRRRPSAARAGARVVRTVPTYTPWERLPPESPPPPPPRVYRIQLSSDPVDEQFLVELRRHPADRASRLVYADLLEERGLLPLANFVRGRDADDDDPNDLLEQSDLAWRAITSRDPVRCARPGCTWDKLAPSLDDERCRHCATCNKLVRYCETIGQERACTERGERGVIDRGGAPRT